MAELAGYLNEVYVLTGSTAMTDATGAKVLGTDNSGWNALCELLEITAFGDTHRNRMAGLKDTSVSLSGNYYPGDTTGQDELVPGDTIYIGIYPSGSGSAGKQVKALVESFEITAAKDGKQEFSASIQGIDAPEVLPAQA
jgi:hypothetical protein